MDALVIIVQGGAGDPSAWHAVTTPLIVVGVIAVAGGVAWAAAWRRKRLGVPRGNVAVATEAITSVPDAEPMSAPPEDDDGDLTVLMRRQA